MGYWSDHDHWRKEPNGDLSATFHDLHLVVQPCDGFTRFIVRVPLPQSHCSPILSSGTAKSIEEAKLAAIRTALRWDHVRSHSHRAEPRSQQHP